VALWRLEAVGEVVTLTYVSAEKAPQKCGEADRSAESELEAWVAEQMQVWDACTVTSGRTFVRVTAPAGGARG
jgi:hypothetical protein